MPLNIVSEDPLFQIPPDSSLALKARLT